MKIILLAIFGFFFVNFGIAEVPKSDNDQARLGRNEEGQIPGTPRFTLLQDRSANGAPSVSITFPDGYKDTLILEQYYANEEERMARSEACHYIGHLANEHKACVAMTGCVGSEDVQFTIMSEHATESPMFKWTKEGNVEIIESPFKNGLAKSEVLTREDDVTEDGDEEILGGPEAELLEAEKACSGGVCTLPATQRLQIRVGYDDGFRTKVGGTSQAEAYIAATWPHIQVSYCHSSLGSKVLVERLPGIKHYAGKTLVASSAKLMEMFALTVSDIGSADLMLYMGYDTAYYGVVGIAWTPVVCNPSQYNKYKSSINEWRQTHTEAAHVMAHEIGHNLGMAHDFTTAHTAAGCDGTGIMSYGNPPNQWSTCSKADFTAQYKVRESMWCMPAAPSACGGVEGGECACVDCTFTVDNVVNSVKYNGNNLQISGGAVNDWRKEKVISFQSCDDSCPGILEIKGTDANSNNHCYWAGLLLRCTASRSSSPWHNFISDKAHWKVENGATPCQNDKLFPVSGAGIPFISALNSFGAKKIWNNNKIATMRGSPVIPACGAAEGGECADVTCKFTVDNVVNSVKYNDNPLQISGGAVNNWQQEKVISFQSCSDSSPGILEIKGTDWNSNNHCYWAGLLLRCTASRSSSPWHNFVSDKDHWKVENGATPCQNDKLFPVVGAGIPFIASLKSFGAKKIWNNKKIAIMRGSPGF